MHVGTRLPIALAKRIEKLHRHHHTSNRGWAINNGFASSTPFEFDYAAYDKDSYAMVHDSAHFTSFIVHLGQFTDQALIARLG